ncbi:uncharacterized protein EV422DRAFT_544807 [Fimicolochytrium jonesii]|uniref:uncharacterized protein n=1 Tax=Fimicolochytrium jonesii TaxID=1396493 RepID=UPI0022FE2B12|nr:uncharacterized protein EV422DRAFT_544807 [Fimicolochytrium jonesii]KAI8816580.1 hypothetical protein EV422DRAFT_544807 [Fimicolochytrium jonesii]
MSHPPPGPTTSAPSSISPANNPGHTIILSFPYALTHYTSHTPTSEILPQIITKVQALCESVAQETGCVVTFTSPEVGGYRSQRDGRDKGAQEGGQMPFEVLMSVTVMGPPAMAGRARRGMLRGIPTQSMLIIRAPHPFLLSTTSEMQPHVRHRLDAIMSSTRTHITCVGRSSNNTTEDRGGMSKVTVVAESPWETMDLEVVGRAEDLEMAKMEVLVYLDQLAGLHIEALTLLPTLHPLLAGRNNKQIELLMHEHQTNIYLPTPFVGETCSVETQAQVNAYARTVWVTGTVQGVTRTVEEVVGVAGMRSKHLQTHTLPTISRKLDWLLLSRTPALLSIMSDNATHIALPALGSTGTSASLVVTAGDRVYLDRTCRAVMYLLCEFYIAGIQLTSNPVPANAKPSHPLVNALSMLPLQTHSEVVLASPYMEIYGLNPFVKSAFLALAGHPAILPLIRDTKFQVELAMEHKDFINGKKNGKINKITKTSGCRVSFQENFNEWNMLIDLCNSTPGRCVEGLGMLEDELPAEISFHVPEAFHKRIIGVGGKNIQRIMKKWAVYVKFSNAEEYAQLGGYFKNMDNVIARTPAKNSANLGHAKASIMELTGEMSKPTLTVALSIPRQLHRFVVGPRAVYLNDITQSTGAELAFPRRESGADEVEVVGTESAVISASNRLRDLVPGVQFFIVPGGQAAFYAVTMQPDVSALAAQLLHELGVEMYVYHPPPPSAENNPQQQQQQQSSPTNNEGSVDCTFMLYFHRHHTPPTSLDAAKGLITEYLTTRGVPLQQHVPKQGMGGRTGSYANLQHRSYDSFQHFPSKLVVGVSSAPQGEASDAAAAAFANFYPPPPHGMHPGGIANSKMAQSTPDLRHLFEDAGPSSSPGRMSTLNAPQHLLRRSKSGLPNPADARDMLSVTLEATSITPQQQQNPGAWPVHFARRQGLMSIDTANTGANEDNDSGMDDPAKNAELLKGFAGMLSPIDAPERGSSGSSHTGGEHQFHHGLKLSRSMGMLDDRGGNNNAQPSRGSSNLVPEISASDPPPSFTAQTIETLFSMERAHPKAFAQTEFLLSSLELENHLAIFIEQEVDFPTILLLGDGDLKELGVRAFGTRKRILGAIRQCKDWRDAHLGSVGNVGGSQQQQQQQQRSHPQQHAQQHHQHQHEQHGRMPYLIPGEYHSYSARASVSGAGVTGGYHPHAHPHPVVQRSSVGSRPQSQQSSHSSNSYQDHEQSSNAFQGHPLAGQGGPPRKGFGDGRSAGEY